MPFIGNQPALSYTSFAKQDFTTSATTSYVLSQPVANANEIALFINFVRQEPTTAYTASGTSLTLTSATSASDDMYVIFLGKAVQTVNPPAGSVGISQLSATGTKDSTTFLRGDNTFGIPPLGGITEADFFRTNASQSISASTQTVISGNWERDDFYFDKIGTGMTESSGIFTFPSTGLYLIHYQAYVYGFGASGSDSAQFIQTKIQGTINNSSYVDLSSADTPGDANTGVRYITNNTQAMFDVTDTSQRKVRFIIYIEGQSGTLYGHTTTSNTFASFIRLGDT